MLFKNCLQELHLWCLCRFSLFILYSLFEGTWTKKGFNVQIFCLLHVPICSAVYVASLACVLPIHWSHRDIFSSLLETWWIFLVFDKCQHFPHQKPTSHLRKGTVKSRSFSKTKLDCVVDVLGVVSSLHPCARVLVFTQRYWSCTRTRITKSNI